LIGSNETKAEIEAEALEGESFVVVEDRSKFEAWPLYMPQLVGLGTQVASASVGV
jgi:hypothetical protein